MIKNFTFSILILIFCASVNLRAQDLVSKKLKHIGWIMGTWKMNLNDGILYENWKWVNDSSCQSYSWKINSHGDSIPRESAQFVFRSGVIYYIPNLAKSGPGGFVPFLVTTFSSHKFEAENPDLAFPQKISYRLFSDGHLEAYVEGMEKGQFNQEVYTMHKVVP